MYINLLYYKIHLLSIREKRKPCGIEKNCYNDTMPKAKEAFGERKNMKKKITGRDILFLQAVIIVYTCSSIAAKLAAGCELFSLKFCLFYGIEIVILGVYALLWQQVIKRFELSVAYANRAMVIVWSMLWAALIFKEQLTVSNIAGILLVVVGTFIVNQDTGGAQA